MKYSNRGTRRKRLSREERIRLYGVNKITITGLTDVNLFMVRPLFRSILDIDECGIWVKPDGVKIIPIENTVFKKMVLPMRYPMPCDKIQEIVESHKKAIKKAMVEVCLDGSQFTMEEWEALLDSDF